MLRMDLLTNFWKKLKHPAWVTRPDILQELSRRIHMHHNMERCVEAELEEYILQMEREKSQALQQAMAPWSKSGSVHMLGRVAKHEDVDPNSDEPLRRIHGFWQTFHRGTRKGDPRPVTPAKIELYLPALNGGWIQPVSSRLPGRPSELADSTVSSPTRGLSTVKSAPELRGKRSPKRALQRPVPGLMATEALQEQMPRWDVSRTEDIMARKRGSPLLPVVPPAVRRPPEPLGSKHCPTQHFGPLGCQRSSVEHAVVPVYSDSGICDELGEEFASPTKQYIHACQREQVVPVPTSFVTGHSKKALVDSDLLTLCAVGRSTGAEEAGGTPPLVAL
eukprot:Skav226156  [mRNA]  locus=scaffold3275:38300:46235:+ [translate_table: standard]